MASDLPKYHRIAALPRVAPRGEDFEARWPPRATAD
jgi:hypothetical protein